MSGLLALQLQSCALLFNVIVLLMNILLEWALFSFRERKKKKKTRALLSNLTYRLELIRYKKQEDPVAVFQVCIIFYFSLSF